MVLRAGQSASLVQVSFPVATCRRLPPGEYSRKAFRPWLVLSYLRVRQNQLRVAIELTDVGPLRAVFIMPIGSSPGPSLPVSQGYREHVGSCSRKARLLSMIIGRSPV